MRGRLAIRFGYYWVASLMGVIGVKLIVSKEFSKRNLLSTRGRIILWHNGSYIKKRVVHLTDAGYMCSI